MTDNTQSLLIIVLFGLQFITLTALVVVYGRMVLYRQTAKDYNELVDDAAEHWGTSLASRTQELAQEKELLQGEKNSS